MGTVVPKRRNKWSIQVSLKASRAQRAVALLITAGFSRPASSLRSEVKIEDGNGEDDVKVRDVEHRLSADPLGPFCHLHSKHVQ